MSKVKIETLTGIHIGSGVTYQEGSDFVRGITEDNEDIIVIVDPRKVMNLIGEENIETWVNAIQRGRPTDEIVKQYAPSAKVTDYAMREISMWSEKSTPTLKEFIHDGRGKPYIPGSSIKGAIRTAILAHESGKVYNKENKLFDRRNNISAKNIESEVFGNDPNHDIMRFLQVGDAVFGKEYEAAVRMVNLNERERLSYWDESKPQLIEILVPEDNATFELRINNSQYEIAKNMGIQMPECMNSLDFLFKAINQHTLHLLNSEVAYWEERADAENADRVDVYLGKLKVLKLTAEGCGKEGKSCVLRIGHGSGWRFITGAWAETLANFKTDVIPKARPRNKQYAQFEFPKTRRVDDECELLGFVKLMLLE
jgi:CRISPR type III-A-associated RAMP protein Csm5